jgi:hypothetical protein
MALEEAGQHPSRSAGHSLGASQAAGTGIKSMETGMHLHVWFSNSALPVLTLRRRSIYGSGYPDTVSARGVAGLGFPFFFWPVVWPGPEIGAGSYLHSSNEVCLSLPPQLHLNPFNH